MDETNRSFFLLINQYAGKNVVFDACITFMAQGTPFILMLLMLALWFFASEDKRRISFFAGYSVLLALLLSYIAGLLYFHPRPFVTNLGTQLVEHAPDASFPSDHTTFIFAISFMYFFSKSTRLLGVILCLISLFAGLARIYVGVHYPLDIAGAALVGGVSSLMVIFLVGKLNCLENFYQLFTCIKLPNWLLKN